MTSVKTKRIQVPESLADITLGQFQTYKEIPEDATEEFVQVRMFEIFANLTPNEVLKMRFKDRQMILNDLVKTLSDESNELIPIIELEGKKFGFIPNLDDITNDEFMSGDQYCREVKDWHKLFAILYRPVTYGPGPGDVYEIEPFEKVGERGDLMKRLPMNVVMGALVFFCDLGAESALCTLKSLKAEIQRPQTSNTVKSGVGILQSLRYRITYFWNWKRFLKNAFLNPFITLPIKPTTPEE